MTPEVTVLLEQSSNLQFTKAEKALYQQFTFIEEMAELVAASIFVWIHYQYAIWWGTHYQFSDAGEL